jgi:alpha-N-arabinofuranosidase
MILTDGARLLRTPTYWVFEMFKVHQGGAVLPVDFQSAPAYALGDASIPAVSASATRHPTSGAVHVSLANTHPREAANFACKLGELAATSVTGRVLTAAAMTAHNTFDAPDALRPAPFDAARLTPDGRLEVDLPPMSVVVLELR